MVHKHGFCRFINARVYKCLPRRLILFLGKVAIINMNYGISTTLAAVALGATLHNSPPGQRVGASAATLWFKRHALSLCANHYVVTMCVVTMLSLSVIAPGHGRVP